MVLTYGHTVVQINGFTTAAQDQGNGGHGASNEDTSKDRAAGAVVYQTAVTTTADEVLVID